MQQLIERMNNFRNLKTTLIGSGSRAFALGSQFIIIIMIAKLLEKADFGNFMIVFSVYRLIGTSIGTGIASVLIYHIGRGTTEDKAEALHRHALILGVIVGAACCVGCLGFSNQIAIAFEKPGLVGWLVSMTPFLAFTLLSTISTGAFDGQNRVAQAILFSETAPNFLRLVLLAPLMIFPLPSMVGIATIMALSVAVPWLASVYRMFIRRNSHSRVKFTAWDISYAAKLTAYNFAGYQVQGVDMIIAGSLFSPERVAEYAVASRIGALFPFFLQLRMRMFAPVATRLIGNKAHSLLEAEVRAAKYFAFVLVALSIAALLIASPLIANIFWNSSTVTTLLLMLAFPPAYRSLFASGDRLLQVAGHANWNLCIMLVSLLLLIAIPYMLAPWLGVLSLPVAMILSGFLLNPVIAFGVRRTTGITINNWLDLPFVAACAAAVLTPLLFLSGSYAAILSGVMFFLIAVTYAFFRRDDLKGAV